MGLFRPAAPASRPNPTELAGQLADARTAYEQTVSAASDELAANRAEVISAGRQSVAEIAALQSELERERAEHEAVLAAAEAA